MANSCINNVYFTASEQNLQALKDLFHEMTIKQQQEQCGQLPPFIEAKEGRFFDIDFEFDDMLHYETRWTPNIEIIKQIADKYNAEFVYSYEELGECIYGEAIYETGVLTDCYLELEDFEKLEYLEDKDEWLFEDELYECEFDILDILLERKKNELVNN